jgi:hypothetical protein
VAGSYLNPIKNKTIVNHIDGDKTNNALENLEYVNNSENILHAIKLKASLQN